MFQPLGTVEILVAIMLWVYSATVKIRRFLRAYDRALDKLR